MSIDSRYGYHFVDIIELNLKFVGVLTSYLPIKLKKIILGCSHLEQLFWEDSLKSTIGYKMVLDTPNANVKNLLFLRHYIYMSE